MKLHVRNTAWLLPLFLTACLNKSNQPPNQQYAPPVSTVPKPSVLHPDLPDSALTLPLEPVDTDTDAILEEAAKPVVRRRRPVVKPPAEGAETASSSASPPQSAANENGEVPAIGELSSGDPPDLRRATNDLIADTETGLRSIERPLNGQEQKTAAQIRQFIRQARKALVTGDVDGAHTLAAKAKVLLSELSE